MVEKPHYLTIVVLPHLHQLISGFPEAELEKRSLKQVKICQKRHVTSAVGVCGWGKKGLGALWTFTMSNIVEGLNKKVVW